MNLSSLKNKISKLPKSPGVYVYYGKNRKVLYVGKATSLRDRVRSYFSQRYDANQRINANLRIANVANRPIGYAIDQIVDIEVRETDSVLEALILESQLIKKYQPKYNAMGKDDKSFCYFAITREEYPRVLILRENEVAEFPISKSQFPNKSQIPNPKIKKNIPNTKYQIPYTKTYGPYTSKKQMEIALKILRKIFPFHSNNQKTEKGCLDYQIGRCPGPYAGAISKADYMKNIRGIRMILEGKKKSLVKKLEKEMKECAARHEFERAADVRNKIFALKHIRDIALLSRDDNFQFPISNFQINSKNQKPKTKNLRLEAYDISNISGQYAVGSMVVFQNNEPDKSQYRKFKIKTVEGSDDVGMMKEVLTRRFKNNWPASTRGDRSSTRGWPMPDLILLDGGMGHLNMAQELISDLGLVVSVAAVAKGSTRKKLIVHGQQFIDNIDIKNTLNNKNLLKRIMDEAHRFAIGYHRNLRKSRFLG